MAGGDTIELVARLERDVQGRVEVTVSTTDGTATAASGDFTLTPTTLIFDGSSIQTFTVAISDDAIVEDTEMFSVGVSGVSRGLTANANFATITIIDNDSAAVTFSASNVTVAEADGTIELTAMLDKAVQGGFDVMVSTAADTATAADYTETPTPPTLAFTGTLNEMKTFTSRWRSPTTALSRGMRGSPSRCPKGPRGGPAGLTVSGTAAITITEDDTAAITLSGTSLSVAEADGTIELTATLDNAVKGGFEVMVSITDGTATSPGRLHRDPDPHDAGFHWNAKRDEDVHGNDQ